MQKDKVEEKEQAEIKEEVTQDQTQQTQSEEAKEEATEQVEEPDELEQLKIEVAESKDKYLRLYSEFENFRRRTSKEKLELINSANQNLMSDLIPVLDDFERAINSLQASEGFEAAKEGMDLIYNKFKKTLETKGLKKMEIEKGTDFNDDFHEAITQIPAGEEMAGKVVDVVENGYFLNDKVVRFAKVVTGANS
ncbi:nucleotide exchange factor GrpE [Marinoscillum sp. MHG1-6]|uniref:nucleotide exchange factor GrpE n=1 Tax=Marinoscillum sp. MHG1-6 TaxID=2959627 RepID=UPI0021580F24|nr:nucleotide exchange factor GrpE [Marinoscillum sp. MHG1-6]